MNELINWVSMNNALMIQICFTIVLVLVGVYIYRLFFVASASSTTDVPETGNVSQLSQKIDQLLQATTMATSTGAATIQTAENSGVVAAQTVEFERLRAEVTTLRTSLNESEKKVFEMAPSPTNELNTLVENNIAQELTKKVEQLEARLAEYDIIAEDIADLSQLRSENSILKKRLNLTDDVAVEPATLPKESIDEPIDLVFEPQSDLKVSSAEQSEELDIKPFNESTEDEVAGLNSEAGETEKNILTEFEEFMKKGSS